MRSLNQSQSIKLGLVLEACIAKMLSSHGYSYNNSESYENLLTRPDFIVFKGNVPIASIAVTTTSSGETWIKKRWRYIDEVAQLKSYFGPGFLTINLFYGNKDVFQTSELRVINAFFDASISAYDLVDGEYLFDLIVNIVAESNDQF